jgi:hypothetical protein
MVLVVVRQLQQLCHLIIRQLPHNALVVLARDGRALCPCIVILRLRRGLRVRVIVGCCFRLCWLVIFNQHFELRLNNFAE